MRKAKPKSICHILLIYNIMSTKRMQLLNIAGFTIVELLIVISIIALLASLIISALVHAKAKARLVVCSSNKKQLGIAWILYANENSDKLVQNSDAPNYYNRYNGWSWVDGWMTWDLAPSNTNSIYLLNSEHSLLAPYITQGFQLYKCPADQYLSPVQKAQGWSARLRSISMNYYFGEGEDSSAQGYKHYSLNPSQYFLKFSDILTPDSLWVILDEHPDSINGGTFILNTRGSSGARLLSLPGLFHQGACTFVFADGHSESKKWESAIFTKPIEYKSWYTVPRGIYTNDQNDNDLQWLLERMTYNH